MKEIVIVEESSVTVRGYRHRTTVPSRVFRFLELKDKDRIRWIVWKDGTVTVRKVGLDQKKATYNTKRRR